MRIAILLGLCAVAYLTFDHTKTGLNAAESSGKESDLKAIFKSVGTGSSIDAQIADMAKDTLSSNALDNRALVQVWLAADGKERERKAIELLSTAGRVSRRSLTYLAADLLTAARNQDIPKVVRAFDRMATLIPAMRASLTELAVPLLDDPEGARLLAQHQSRPWFVQFVTIGIRQPDRLNQIAAFLASAEVSDSEVRSRLLEKVTNAFLKQNMVENAQAFASSFGEIKDFDFNSLNFSQPPDKMKKTLLTWQFPNPEAQPLFESNGDLRFAIRSDAGSEIIAEKMLLLENGRHHIAARLAFIGTMDDVAIGWKVRCGNQPVRHVSNMQQTNDNRQKILVLGLDVSENCRGVHLSLILMKPLRQFDSFDIVISNPIHRQVN